jgi:hypothetical protein
MAKLERYAFTNKMYGDMFGETIENYYIIAKNLS